MGGHERHRQGSIRGAHRRASRPAHGPATGGQRRQGAGGHRQRRRRDFPEPGLSAWRRWRGRTARSGRRPAGAAAAGFVRGRAANFRPCDPTQRAAVATGAQHHRRRFGQGRRGQVHHRGQPGAGPGRRRRARRRARCGRLRAQHPDHARPLRAPRQSRRQIDRADARARHRGDVDRPAGRTGHADDLARADGHFRADPVARADAVGWRCRPGLPDRRPAAGHRRHPAHPGAEDPGRRRGDRDHAAGRGHPGCAQGPEDVREGAGAGAGPGREHGHAHLRQLRPRRARVRRRRRYAHGGAIRNSAAGQPAAGAGDPRAGRRRRAGRGLGAGLGRGQRLSRHRARAGHAPGRTAAGGHADRRLDGVFAAYNSPFESSVTGHA